VAGSSVTAVAALSRSTAEPDATDGAPECDVSTNIRRCPSSRSHITGLFESTVPGSVITGALASDARGTAAAANGAAP
jgi:hypothetical protein